jgi:aminotransferase
MQVANRMDNISFSGIRKVFEKVNELESAGQEIIHLEIGRPDFDSPGHVVNAAVDALQAGKVHYTSNYGIVELRAAIAEKLSYENNVNYHEADEIIVTAGANEAVFISMLALINPGEEVLIPCPAWPTYFACVHMAGGIPVPVQTNVENGFTLDVEKLEAAITLKTKMLILNTPNNPTGAVYDRDLLLSVARLVEKHDLLVFSDEIYEKIIYDDRKHVAFASLPGMRERTLTVNGFSKAYSMTGWRLAYVAADRNIISALIRIHQNTIACATSFAQWGGLEALSCPTGAIIKMVQSFRHRRDLVYERISAIPRLGLKKPCGTFYAFIDISELGMNSFKVAERLLEKARVAVAPGSVFGAFADNFIRISYVNTYETLECAMSQIEETIAHY